MRSQASARDHGFNSLICRHLKTTEDLVDNRASPRTEAMAAAAVRWAERIMRKIDNVSDGKDKIKIEEWRSI